MKPLTPEQQTFAETYASKQGLTLDTITPEQRNKLLTAYRADKKRKADKTNNTATVSIALNQQAYEMLSTTAKAKGLTLSKCIIEQFANRYDVTHKQNETNCYDVTPALKTTKSKLHQHQDNLMIALVDYFGGRDAAKVQLTTQLGIKEMNNPIGALTTLDAILDIYAWLNSKPPRSN
jgi:hypothetical protein